MSVFTYSVTNLPTTPPEPTNTGMGTGHFACPLGTWSSAQIRVQGTIPPDSFGVHFVGTCSVEASFAGGAYDTISAVAVTNDLFDTGYYNGANAIGKIKANLGKSVNVTYFMTFTYQGRAYTAQVTSTDVQLTGTPAPTGGVEAPALVRIQQMAPNLFFETPVYSPLELPPPLGPITYPPFQLGPGFQDTEFFPNGAVVLSPDLANVPLPGPPQGGGNKQVSCMRRKGGVYAFLGQSNVPALYCVNLPGDAEFLFFSPGLINSGGASGQTSYGFRIYRGLNGFKPGQWVTGYNALAQAPDYVGAGTLANLIPWQGTLQFCVEVYGVAAIPANSLLDFTIQGLDT